MRWTVHREKLGGCLSLALKQGSVPHRVTSQNVGFEICDAFVVCIYQPLETRVKTRARGAAAKTGPAFTRKITSRQSALAQPLFHHDDKESPPGVT
eukprot:1781297-Prymnesium_polylepis.1